MAQMTTWLRNRLSRRALLVGGVAAAGGSAISAAGTLRAAEAQTTTPAHSTCARQARFPITARRMAR